MNRLSLLVIGFFVLLGALLVLWWLSPSSVGAQRAMGLGPATVRPKDIALLLHLLFAIGLIVVGGYFVQSMEWTLMSVLSGAREPVKEAITQMLVWGAASYLFITVLFGVAVVMLFQGGVAFGQFLEPAFVAALLSWPYQFVAAAGVFGLPPEAFY